MTTIEEASQQAQAAPAPVQPKTFKALTLVVRLDDEAELAEVLRIAAQIGNVESLNIGPRYDGDLW